jgi:hypothetical protein
MRIVIDGSDIELNTYVYKYTNNLNFDYLLTPIRADIPDPLQPCGHVYFFTELLTEQGKHHVCPTQKTVTVVTHTVS